MSTHLTDATGDHGRAAAHRVVGGRGEVVDGRDEHAVALAPGHVRCKGRKKRKCSVSYSRLEIGRKCVQCARTRISVVVGDGVSASEEGRRLPVVHIGQDDAAEDRLWNGNG